MEVTGIEHQIKETKKKIKTQSSNTERNRITVDIKKLSDKQSAIESDIDSLKAKIALSKQQREVLINQGESLAGCVDSVKKQRQFKSTHTLQSTINYILYTIFILNAFIGGFGMANLSS